MNHSARRGEKSELAVASELLAQGYGVSFPFGHNHQYDLIVDKDGSLYRVQVKTAKREGGNRFYVQADADAYDKTHVDLLAGYSEEKEPAFFIPIEETSGKRQRVTFTDLDQMGSDASRQRAHHISDYRFSEAIKRV
ncbi:group I intron-associated PD-(D/E)XK endonuclease [Halorubrum coriense]|uniref:group I intron-associated PD-(D/E)XK endonuclease n=1 Tax=Halorubrum coriense TaxID=64713 RepID=UPI00126919D4|nr:group I intron-associated PD-(D/E)XK endonuclease [Halorubrum coriense]